MQSIQNHVHIWHGVASASDILEYRLEEVLREEERSLVKRLKTKTLQEHAIFAYAMRRHLLANYLATAPKAIIFAKTNRGKPTITHPKTALEFNISHSSDYILMALHASRPVGIDVEKMREVHSLEIANRFFAKEEYAALQSIHPKDQTKAFYALWTSKEAVLKAAGLGIALSLEKCKCTLSETDQIIMLDNEAWRVRSIPTENDYAAALATDPSIEIIQHFSYNDFLKDHPLC